MNRLKQSFIMMLFIGLLTILVSCNVEASEQDTIQSKNELISILEKYKNHYYGGMPEMADGSTNQKRDYSETNTQVAGVDEADLVKTDGTYIYLASQNKVEITKAYPANEMEINDTITYEDFYPTSLYVDDDYLVVIGSTYNRGNGYYWMPTSQVYIYEKGDYESPKDIIEVSGYIVTTRKVDGELLLISSEYIYYNPEDKSSLELPEYSINQSTIELDYSDIHYKDGVYPNAFVSLLKVNLNDTEDYKNYTYLGSSDNVYVSHHHVYVAQQIHPYYFELTDNEKENKTETVITQIAYQDEQFGQSNSVTVDGYILNQFSMDEYDNTFRVATTTGQMWNSNDSQNIIYIFDDQLERLSSIEGIAPGEQIKSARFVGPKIYIVTFKQIDPFFVIDVTDPRNPSKVSELKLPGYSTYLHPYDKDHIIGFGFETEIVNYHGQEFTRISGIKMTMFDVTNEEEPEVMFTEILTYGDNSYVYSELNHNHKALLFSKDHNLMAFPLTYTSYEENQYTYKQSYKVYDVNLTDGFTLKKDITHFDEAKSNGYQYGYQILRGLYIEENLYTVSYSKVKVHDLDTFDEVGSIEFNFEEDWWMYPYYG